MAGEFLQVVDFGKRSNPPCGDCDDGGHCTMNCGPRASVKPNNEQSNIFALPKKMETPHDLFYLVSAKHTREDMQYIMFWGHERSGYYFSLAQAGLYTRAEIEAHEDYYHNECDTFPIPIVTATEMMIKAEAGFFIEGSAGPVIQNNKENWRRLRAGQKEKLPTIKPIKPKKG